MLNVLRVLVATVLIVKCTHSQTSPFPPQFTGPTDHLRTRVPPTESQFRVVYEWRVIDFAFPLEQLRLTAIYNHDYIPQNNLISDVKAFANRLYVTMPRMLPGVPATLGWVVMPDNNGRTDPEIEPFPSWAMNERANCSAMQFVQGIAIDAYGILWAVDSGRTETLAPGPGSVVCGPKLWMFDLRRNGSLIHRYDFPEEVVSRGSNYLNKIVVDDAFGGFAYITDNSGADPGIVVFSRKLNTAWKVRENNSMRAAQNAVQFAVNGTNLGFAIHIDGIALGPYFNPNVVGDNLNRQPLHYDENFERNVYYSPLSSFHLYSIPASVLRNPDFARTASPRQVMAAVTDHGVKSSQTDGMIMDNEGNLFFGLLAEHAIAQWNSYTPFTVDHQRVIARDPFYIQWTDGMSFDSEGHLYVVVNRLHNFVAGRLDTNHVNFRILRSTTGTQSYVNTAAVINGAVTDNGISIPDGIYDTTAFGQFAGFPTTTPQYSGLGSERRYYYNNAATNINSKFLLTVLTLLAVCLHLRR
uniref:Putative yellow-related salivary protein n=1 Tax=Nyssomyia neivai TaxID=330878 RepID=A0A1L8DNC9_9DIPT